MDRGEWCEKKIRGGVGHAHGLSPRGWGRGKPTRSQPLAIPQLIADEPFLYTAEEQAHMGRLLYGEADSIPHEEEGGGWDMLDRDVECRRKRGYAGEGCGMRKEVAGM